jgi:hypothetical protein
MTKDEALRLAWDALQQIAHVSAMDYEYQQWAVEAITAIKAALEAPQRTWVGLTDEEIDSMVEITDLSGAYYYDDLLALAKAIEAKLREKNT